MPLSPITVEMTVAESTQQFDMTVDAQINPTYDAHGTIDISENGITDVAQYANARVNVQDIYPWAHEWTTRW